MKHFITIVLLLFVFESYSQNLGIYLGMSNSHCLETDPFGQFQVGGIFRVNAVNDRLHVDNKIEWRNTDKKNYIYASMIGYYDFFRIAEWQTGAKLSMSLGAGGGYNGYNVHREDNPTKYNVLEAYAAGKIHFTYDMLFAEIGSVVDVFDLQDNEFPSYHIAFNFGVLLNTSDNN